MSLPDTTYASTLSGKGALLDETVIVLGRVAAGDSVETVREQVLNGDLLLKTTLATRRSVWDHIRYRYLGDAKLTSPLADLAARAPNRATARMALFYEFCQSEPLLHDTVLQCVHPRYASGFSGVSKADIQAFFDGLAPSHPELAAWSPQTRDKVASNILSILRDFGLLEGAERKQFARLYVPLPAFVYVLYRLRDKGLTTASQVVEAEAWRLFLLDRPDVLTLLEEAHRDRRCIFKQQADVMSLDWTYPTLEACVEALAGQV